MLVKLFYSCMCFLCNSRFKSSLELMLCVIDISTLNKTYLIWWFDLMQRRVLILRVCFVNIYKRKWRESLMCIRANIWHLIGLLNQTAADVFLPFRAFEPSSSDSADRGRSIIRVRHGHESSRIWKLFANFTLIQCIKIVSRFFGPRYIGDDFF